MKKLLPLLLVLGLALGGWHLWAAGLSASKQFKPVAVVSLSGYDKTMTNIALLGRATANAEIAGEIVVILRLVSLQQGLSGPDRARPWGAAIRTDGETLSGCAFIPSPNLAKLAAAVEPFVGKAEDQGGGVYKIKGNWKPVYITQKNGWAFFAYRSEDLEYLPDDPMALLDGLNAQYDAAARIYVKNLLPKQRRQATEWLKTQLEPYAEQWQSEPDSVYAVRKKITDVGIRPVVEAFDDVDTLTVGWTLDTAAKTTSWEAAITMQEGSSTAQSLAKACNVKTQFGGFQKQDTVFSANWSGQLPTQNITALDPAVEAIQYLTLGDSAAEENTGDIAAVARQLASDLAVLVQKNLKSGRIDGAMAVDILPESVAVLGGGCIADGATLNEAILSAVAAATERKPALAEYVQLNVEEYQNVRFHRVSIPIPADCKMRERFVSLVGDNLEVIVGVGGEAAYLAVGRNPLDAIKQAIDRSAASDPQTASLAQWSVALGPAARYVAASDSYEGVRSIAALVAMALDPSAGRDHLRLNVAPIPNGLKCRMEAEEGVLKLIDRLSRAIARDNNPKPKP